MNFQKLLLLLLLIVCQPTLFSMKKNKSKKKVVKKSQPVQEKKKKDTKKSLVTKKVSTKRPKKAHDAQPLVHVQIDPTKENDAISALQLLSGAEVPLLSIAAEQLNTWECGYRAVYNAWLIMMNNFSHKGIDFNASQPSFKEWIELMKKRWATIFGTSRSFMNGKWEEHGEVLAAWKSQTELDFRSLRTVDVQLLIMLACTPEENQKELVQEFVKKHEENTLDLLYFPVPNISITHCVDYAQQDKGWWSKEKYIRYNIARFKHESQSQIVIMHEESHWTTMLLVPQNHYASGGLSYAIVVDSLPSAERLIDTIVYTMFINQPFPTIEHHNQIFNGLKIIKSLKKEPYKHFNMFKDGCLGLYRDAIKKGFIEEFMTHLFRQKSLPLPEECLNKNFEETVVGQGISPRERHSVIEISDSVEAVELPTKTTGDTIPTVVRNSPKAALEDDSLEMPNYNDQFINIFEIITPKPEEEIFASAVTDVIDYKGLLADALCMVDRENADFTIINHDENIEIRQYKDNLLFLNRVAYFLKPEIVDILKEKDCVELREISSLNNKEIISRVVFIEKLGTPEEAIYCFFNTALYITESFLKTYINNDTKAQRVIINKVVMVTAESLGKDTYRHEYKDMLSTGFKEFEHYILYFVKYPLMKKQEEGLRLCEQYSNSLDQANQGLLNNTLEHKDVIEKILQVPEQVEIEKISENLIKDENSVSSINDSEDENFLPIDTGNYIEKNDNPNHEDEQEESHDSDFDLLNKLSSE